MTSSVTAPKWRRLPEERPQQILQAALEEFGERGLSAARLDDIARRAGVSKGTIYLYFPNKEELFREMIRQTVVARLEAAEQEVALLSGTAADQLQQYMRTWWDYLRCDTFQTIHRLVHGELHRFPDLAEFYAREAVMRSRALVGSLVRRGIEQGEFRAVEPVAAAQLIASLLISRSIWCTKQHVFRVDEPTTVDAAFEQVADFVLHALRQIPDSLNAPLRP